MILIVNYGLGNIGSIQNMLKKVGIKSIISSNAEDIYSAEKIILPGVGAFDNGINNLNKLGLIDALREKVVRDKTPILGICLGMQLFTEKSEEGILPGLGWIKAETIKFLNNEADIKIPHMGWNTIKIEKENCIFKGMFDNPRFYFVHSYHVKCQDNKDIIATTNHGIDFVSVLEKDNILGIQFHPEKSHKFGMKILKNFGEM